MRVSGIRCLCALAFWLGALTACDNSDPAPGVPPVADDSGTMEQDSAPPPPIDCTMSMGQQDADGDGFSREKGDCDDCTMAIGPAAIEVPGNMIDEDCDGSDLAAPPASCDDKLEPDSADAEDAAQVFGLCESHSQNSRLPGLIEASWQRLSGETAPPADARQVWFPTRFGTIGAREGKRLVVLSTGVARDTNEEDDYTEDCDVFDTRRAIDGSWMPSSSPPEGFPRDSSQCPKGVSSRDAPAYNDVVLHLTLRAPSNAKSLSFDSLFLTYEYPDFVCSRFNDFFVVLMDPEPKGLDDDEFGNILFDSEGDPIGVNSGLLSVCRKAERGRVARPIDCEAGPALLADTGFDQDESSCASKQTPDAKDIGGAATGWLHTSVPVQPGKVVSLRFMLWDSADPLLDSTVLIDNFQWSLEEKGLATGPISGG